MQIKSIIINPNRPCQINCKNCYLKHRHFTTLAEADTPISMIANFKKVAEMFPHVDQLFLSDMVLPNDHPYQEFNHWLITESNYEKKILSINEHGLEQISKDYQKLLESNRIQISVSYYITKDNISHLRYIDNDLIQYLNITIDESITELKQIEVPIKNILHTYENKQQDILVRISPMKPYRFEKMELYTSLNWFYAYISSAFQHVYIIHDQCLNTYVNRIIAGKPTHYSGYGDSITFTINHNGFILHFCPYDVHSSMDFKCTECKQYIQ